MLPTPSPHYNDPNWKNNPGAAAAGLWWPSPQQQQTLGQPPLAQPPLAQPAAAPSAPPGPVTSPLFPPSCFPPSLLPAYILPQSSSSSASSSAAVRPSAAGAGTVKKGAAAWVGKLHPKTTDIIVRKILAECGQITKYSRTLDPTTGAFSTFAVLEFVNGLGAVRAAKFLDGLLVGGRQWMVKIDPALLARGPALRLEHISRLRDIYPNKSAADLEAMVQEEETSAMNTIKALADNENKAVAAAEAAAAIEAAAAAKLAPSSAGGAGAPPDEENNSSPAKRPRQKRPPSIIFRDAVERIYRAVEVLPEFRGSSVAGHRFARYSRHLNEKKNSLRRALNAWQADEASHAAQRRRAQQKVVAVADSDIRRLIKYDLEDHEYFLSSSGNILPYSSLSSKALAERLELVTKELDFSFRREDLPKKQEGKEEKDEEEEEKVKAEKAATAPGEEQPSKEEDLTAPAQKAAEFQQQEETISKLREEEPPPSGEKQLIKKEEMAGGSGTNNESATTSVMQLRLAAAPAAASIEEQQAVAESAAVPTVFAEDEVGVSGGAPPDLPMDLHVTREAAERKRLEEEERLELLVARVKEKIPRNKNEILEFPLAWDLLKASGIIDEKLRPWVQSKVEDITGETNAEFTSFIVNRLSEGPQAAEFLEEVGNVFDDDAEAFVLRLWKLLIFESLRLTDDDEDEEDE